MSPNIALQFPIAHRPSDLVGLEMPPVSNVFEHSRLLLHNVSAAVFVKVLYREALGTINRRLDENVTTAISDSDAWSQ